MYFQSECKKDEYCLPITPNTTNVANKLKNKSLIVLVRPLFTKSWLDVDPTLKDGPISSNESLYHVCEVGLGMVITYK